RIDQPAQRALAGCSPGGTPHAVRLPFGGMAQDRAYPANAGSFLSTALLPNSNSAEYASRSRQSDKVSWAQASLGSFSTRSIRMTALALSSASVSAELWMAIVLNSAIRSRMGSTLSAHFRSDSSVQAEPGHRLR